MNAATPLAKHQRLTLIGVGLALALIFSGVVLQVFFPSRGEPLAAPPSVSYPADIGEEDMEPIPPDYFDQDSGDSSLTPGTEPL